MSVLLAFCVCFASAVVFTCRGSECRRATADIKETSSFVCECSADYCDDIPPHSRLRAGQYAVYSSSKDKDRFRKTTDLFENRAEYNQRLILDDSRKYQTIVGFGGSFTDSATMTIQRLSPGAKRNLMKSYFSSEGIEYSMGRIPIASCDFSTRVYSYDDTPGDFELDEFMLAHEDIKHKIPIIREAMVMSPHELKLIGSPWSAPAWMKTNNKMTGGRLIGEPGEAYYKTWARYFVKFLEEYKSHEVPIWGLTIQNEPSSAYVPFGLYSWQSMAMPANTAKEFVKRDLGPALVSHGYGDIKLMSHDDNVPSVLRSSQTIYNDEEASAFLAGIAIHGYRSHRPGAYRTLERIHEAFPDKFLLSTEACEGYQWLAAPVKLGDWERGEWYSLGILQDLNHWVTGWVDWNLALDLTGGPNWNNNNVDSPIIVDAHRDVFYKQPMFYHMGHFSKFVPPGSVRINLKSEGRGRLHSIAFKKPDNSKVLILQNTYWREQEVSVYVPGQGYINIKVPPRSIHTYLW